ncbi:MAG: 1-deoxy-D-xylulose-5-phosphate synthase [Ruminococcaceae bacterium]|nr:1-deoxy-D-xylulose-5-phosphate synthase [Oscillospiraceae bacterium]
MDLQKPDFETTYPLLSKVNSPEDLKALPAKEIKPLCEEIRSYLIEQISENGGHLASNLGVVELTLAIHRVFNSPKDHIIFDVGHQCYVHKLLTGRRDVFSTIRQSGGISGFPKRSESEHDAFGTGHSSTSLSAALGFAEADLLQHSDAYTVCVLGDGAYTGGMIHEALNNCKSGLRLIIILNENEMSISKNNGKFAKSLSKLRASRGYIKTKNFFGRFFRMIPLIGKWIFKRLLHFKRGMKAAVFGSNIFEDLGLFYMGPADGNREEVVERLLREAKDCRSSCIIHLKTQKGKGYSPAEKTPDRFHGMSPATAGDKTGVSFSEAMGIRLSEMADTDLQICAITAAMADGTGLEHFHKSHPRRFYDVGIAEEHAVTFAAGLAANGMKPAVAVYSTFLQRAYDNLIHDVSLQNLPVVLFVDRAGLNPGDGPTHAGVFDVAFLSQVPNLRIYTPIALSALYECMNEAFYSGGAAAVRYPNGKEDPEIVSRFYADPAPVADHIRADEALPENPDVVIVTHGRIVSQAMLAKKELQSKGLSVAILLMEQIAPCREVAGRLAKRLPQKPCRIVFLEEEIREGGFGMQFSAALREMPAFADYPLHSIALENAFVVPEAGETVWDAAKLSAPFLVEKIQNWISQN